jgi:hypothetical protein
VFNLDPRLRGLPATREQVVSLHQSINAPHVAIPGKQAGPAQAFILGVRAQGGFAVYIYLYLSEVGDCAIYASDQRAVAAESFAGEESEAMGFVESMGFMMDNVNFRALPPADQDELVKNLPVFQREPKPPEHPVTPLKGTPVLTNASTVNRLGRILSAF